MLRRSYRERAEYHEQLKIAVNQPQPEIAEIESLCRAWALTDKYVAGYENCLRILAPVHAARVIQYARREVESA